MTERLLTVDEVAERLAVHPNTVRRLVERREIRPVRVGRLLRFTPEDLDAYLAKASA